MSGVVWEHGHAAVVVGDSGHKIGMKDGGSPRNVDHVILFQKFQF